MLILENILSLHQLGLGWTLHLGSKTKPSSMDGICWKSNKHSLRNVHKLLTRCNVNLLGPSSMIRSKVLHFLLMPSVQTKIIIPSGLMGVKAMQDLAPKISLQPWWFWKASQMCLLWDIIPSVTQLRKIEKFHNSSWGNPCNPTYPW